MTRDTQHCDRELLRKKIQFLSNLELLPVEFLDLASLDEQQNEDQRVPPAMLDNVAMVLVNLASPLIDQELENGIGEMSSGNIAVEAVGSSSSTDNVPQNGRNSSTCDSVTCDVKSFTPESTPTKSTKCKDPEREYEKGIEQLKLFLLDGTEEILASNSNELLAPSSIELQTELQSSTPGSESDKLEAVVPVSGEFLLDLSNDNADSDVKDANSTFILDCEKEETANRLQKYSTNEIPDEDVEFLQTPLIDRNFEEESRFHLSSAAPETKTNTAELHFEKFSDLDLTRKQKIEEASDTGDNNFDARNATAESVLHSDIQKNEQNSSNSSIQYLLNDVRDKVIEKTMPNSTQPNERNSNCNKSVEFSLSDIKDKIIERMIPSSIQQKDNKSEKLKRTTSIKSKLNNNISISPKHENQNKNGKLKEVLLDRKATNTNIKSKLSRKNEIQDETFQIEQLKQFLLDDAQMENS